MARPTAMLKPEIRLRNGVYYAYWYDPAARETKRRSLRTSDRRLAESAIAAYTKPERPAYAREHRGDEGQPLEWRGWAVRMCRRARENAKAKGREYAIDSDYVLDLMRDQDFCCAVTRIPFSNAIRHRNPFAPSLDQIAAGGGYLPGNLRVVAMIVNTAMNSWGEEPLRRLIFESRLVHQLAAQTGVQQDENVG